MGLHKQRLSLFSQQQAIELIQRFEKYGQRVLPIPHRAQTQRLGSGVAEADFTFVVGSHDGENAVEAEVGEGKKTGLSPRPPC